jgi:hypothetical protein
MTAKDKNFSKFSKKKTIITLPKILIKAKQTNHQETDIQTRRAKRGTIL